jgi:DoxX-like protein
MKNKKVIAGWVLSGLLSAFLIVASATPKFIQWEGKKEMMEKLGWTTEMIFKIGFVEAALAILVLIPRVAFLATVLLTAYLGGAVATHVRISEAQFVFPIVFGILAWVALGLRDPRVFATAFQRPPSKQAD